MFISHFSVIPWFLHTLYITEVENCTFQGGFISTLERNQDQKVFKNVFLILWSQNHYCILSYQSISQFSIAVTNIWENQLMWERFILAMVSEIVFYLFIYLNFFLILFNVFWFLWCCDWTQGLMHARQALYHQATSQPLIFYYSFIHMCVHFFGSFLPLLFLLPRYPTSPSLPGRICPALISNFVEEKT
jgi:hypothetical protein